MALLLKYLRYLRIVEDIEAGAGFVRKLAVAVNGGLWELAMEDAQQLIQAFILRSGAGVFGLAILVQAPDIADADAMLVMAGDMCADFLNRTAHLQSAVKCDDKVITDAAEAALFVPGIDIGCGEILALLCGGAMDDDFVDASHGAISPGWSCMLQLLSQVSRPFP